MVPCIYVCKCDAWTEACVGRCVGVCILWRRMHEHSENSRYQFFLTKPDLYLHVRGTTKEKNW